MAAENQVEIRFRIQDEKAAAPAAAVATLSTGTPAQTKPQDFTQKERDSEKRLDKVVETKSRFERMEHRLEYRMRRLAGRMVGSLVAQEIGDIVGVNDSFLGRMGSSGVEGAMIGGLEGAAIRMSMTLIHGLIDQVKANSDEVKRMKALHAQQDAQLFKNWIDFVAEANEKRREMEERLMEIEDKFKREFRDYIMNSARFINAPYLGAGGG